jgi:hypothetical protein
MSGMRNWKLGAAVVVGAAFVGAGGAVAAGKLISPGERSQAVVDDAAKQLGVEPAKLSAALKKALENQIDADVAAGRMTKEHGEAMKARIEAGDLPLLDVGPRFGGFGHGSFRGHVGFGGLDAAATYLGVTEEQLRTEIASGKTLAEVAKAKGKSVDGLVDALVADAKTKIAAAVTAGRLSQAEADRLTTSLEEHVTELVNGTVGPRFGPGRGFGLGHGFGFGHERLFGGLDAAASYLGLTEAQLHTELMSGKTLADVAKAKGKSVDGLVDALTADAKRRLADAVAAGRITKADAEAALAEMKQRVTDRVNGVRGPEGMRGFRHGGPDFSGPPPVDPPA